MKPDRVRISITPPRDVVNIHVRVPRDRRAELHFHLEASDGLGYLEEDGSPDLGVVHTPPELVDDMLDYLARLRDDMQVEVLKIDLQIGGRSSRRGA